MWSLRHVPRTYPHFQIWLLILLGDWCWDSVLSRRIYEDKEESLEGTSFEEPLAFSAEFGDFFDGGFGGGLGPVGLKKKLNFGDYPHSAESRNATRYAHPSSSLHAVPSRYKSVYRPDGPHPFRKEDVPYRREPKGSGYYQRGGSSHKPAYRRDEPGHLRSEPTYRTDGSGFRDNRPPVYRQDGGSYREDRQYRNEDPRYYNENPRYRNDESRYRPKEPYRNKDPSYRKDGPRYHYEGRSNHKEESPRVKEEITYRSNKPPPSKAGPKPPPHRKGSIDAAWKKDKTRKLQTLYDDWAPEEEKYEYRHTRVSTEPQEEADEYSDESSNEEVEERSHPYVPASDRPGPPYHGPKIVTRGQEPRVYETSFGIEHTYHRPTVAPKVYYAPSVEGERRRHTAEGSELHLLLDNVPKTREHRYGFEESSFKPSPPDPFMNERLRRHENSEYSQPAQSNPLSKSVIPTSLSRGTKSCVKLKKSPQNISLGMYAERPISCYTCVDEKTGSNFEECLFDSDSKVIPVTKPNEQEKTVKSKVLSRKRRKISPHLRKKRQSDFYDSSERYYDRGSSKGHKYGPEESLEEDTPESSSEYESEENDCYKTTKGEMSCVVCKTPNKKGSFEKCSYNVEPKKYEHSVEKVYGSPRLPMSSPSRYQYSGPDSSIPYGGDISLDEEDYDTDDRPRGRFKKKSNRKSGVSGFPGIGGFPFSSDLFPDMSGEDFDFDSIPEPAQIKKKFLNDKRGDFSFNMDDLDDLEIPKDVGHFEKKNRSDCKKVVKDKMTCYHCVAANGTKHEECMYVEASEPQSKHVSFSQVEEYSSDPRYLNRTESQMHDPTLHWGKRKYKKFYPDLSNVKYSNRLKEKATIEASRWPRSPNKTSDKVDVASEQGNNENGEENSWGEEKKEETSENNEEETNRKEMQKSDHRRDTESVWEPSVGMSLPRYMMEPSEGEAAFDEVFNTGYGGTVP